MKPNIILKTSKIFVKITALSFFLSSNNAYADNDSNTTIGNFGLPGIIDLPTARRLPDGELIITQQLHRSLARSGITFQALPSVGVSFRYSGHGIDGPEAMDVLTTIGVLTRTFHWLEKKYLPAISLGLRILLGQGGIPLNMQWQPSQLET